LHDHAIARQRGQHLEHTLDEALVAVGERHLERAPARRIARRRQRA
jgi:hypothetical protein